MAVGRTLLFLSMVSALVSPLISPVSTSYTKPCLPGWVLFNDHCYRITPEKLTFNAAEAFCQGFANGNGRGHLASVHDDRENDFIAQLASLTGIGGRHGWVWIGLNDAQKPGEFVWTDGTAGSYRNWSPGEPTAYGEDYVAIRPMDGRWNDGSANKRAVCKMPFGDISSMASLACIN
ncbi:snaclec rhodocetin subunit gamma-like [Acanthaster planci]|uniref:Snaclec rhodocetin subunit gamma-like n=1 Tax=Acanthaster planci TaxID=133434 RepID=A0A8B7ZCY6_ACAPL|nr:snaclec rhodocetin subunit gamma-like [Acanthaster planci]